MSEQIKNFINNIYNDKSSDAGEDFKDAIRAKVGDALDTRRKEMSKSMFNQKQGEWEESPYNEPKPEIADPGTFAPDGTVINNTETKVDMDLTDAEDK
tara:strand:+ start:324 stop:617 length:294 start_codon:yes stop_codon:yes gene_type:complete